MANHCRLLILVYHAQVANFNVTNMPFNAIYDNKILAKISDFLSTDNIYVSILYDYQQNSSLIDLNRLQQLCTKAHA